MTAANSEISGISGYLKEYKELNEKIKSGAIKLSGKKIKIALLSSSTITGIGEVLAVKCAKLGIESEIYAGNYNQYSQEILDKTSRLYKFNPGIVILSIDLRAVLGDLYFSYYQAPAEKKAEFFEGLFKHIVSLAGAMKSSLSSKIIIHNFEVPLYSPLGIVENKQQQGFVESVELLNARLRDAFRNDEQIFVFDYDSFCSKIGKENVIDYKMYYFGDIKLKFAHFPKLCESYLSYIKPMLSLTKKCIVLDLDNTLWGGIVGEDGFEGIKLGPTPEGRPFMEFQKALLALFNRGIILAINSKNNPADALKVIKEHPYMILREDNFAAMQINWTDKISNMKALADELSIGLDSFVFIDDDKLNQEMIRTSFPEIFVVDLPQDPSLYFKALMELDWFNSFQITEEDRKRGKMYSEQRKRAEFSKAATDITDYLRELQSIVTVEKANAFNIPRISQLTQKTNQFNMTTRRYLEEEIKSFASKSNFLVFSVKVEDKFGDNGITGAAIVEKKKDSWVINTFLLSCRVIGRKVEDCLLAYIAEEARKANAKLLVGEFIPTEKNAPAKETYKNNGFKLAGKQNNAEQGIVEKGNVEIWEFDLKNSLPYPDFIKMIKK